MKSLRRNSNKDFKHYLKQVIQEGTNLQNVNNVAAHWLYGTEPSTLSYLSKRGIVYNPPGF